MSFDLAFWSGVLAGIVSTGIVAALRGAGRVVLSWLGLARVGRAWGSKTAWRVHRVSDSAFQLVLTFCESAVTVTAVTPISGLARYAELDAPSQIEGDPDHLPRVMDAGDRLVFATRFDYDEGLWIRGFVYEVSWYETRNGKRRGFRTRVKLTFSQPPLTRA